MSKKNRLKKNQSGQASCDICNTQTALVTHHIRGREIPEAEHKSNKTDVCPNCHYNIHLGNIIIEEWCNTTIGRQLIWHEKGEPSITGNDAIPHIIT